MLYLQQILFGILFLSLPGFLFGQIDDSDSTSQEQNLFNNYAQQNQAYLVQYFRPASDLQTDRIESIIGKALNFYIQESVRIDGNQIKLKKSVVAEGGSV